MTPEVILFGLDGATFTVMDDLVQRGILPNFEKFYREGVRAKMTSTIPPLTPPAWSALVTGRSPANHGVMGFIQYAEANSATVLLTSHRQFTAETLWAMANRHGKRAGSLNFVIHQPAPKIDGWVIPGWVSRRWLKGLSHPTGLFDRLKQGLPGFDVKTLALDFDEEVKAVIGAPIDDYEDWIVLHLKRERQWFEVMKYLVRTDPVALLGVVLDGVDKVQHLLWPYLDPALEPADPSEEYLRIRSLAWEYYRLVDGLLGETVELWGDHSTILICSDHGFAGSWEVFFINVWLERQGYLTWAPGIAEVDPGTQELEGAYYNFDNYDWATTKAYAMTASSNGIYINVKGKRRDQGIPPEDYAALCRELKHKLLTECVDPETGEALVTRVWLREEAFPGVHMENAPDLTVELRDFGFFSVRRTDRILSKRVLIMGTHHPDGILVARGPGIRRGASIDTVSILDVAPTALFAMGVEIPEDLEGRFLEEIYTPEYVRAHGAKRGAATASVAATADSTEAGARDEDLDVLEKMKALGYLE